MGALLLADEEPPLITINAQGRSRFVLICEHAARLMPNWRKTGRQKVKMWLAEMAIPM